MNACFLIIEPYQAFHLEASPLYKLVAFLFLQAQLAYTIAMLIR